MRPLILDIWQFYRAERLYLLQIIKEILSHSPPDDGAVGDAGVLAAIRRRMSPGLKGKLIDQLRAAVKERPPTDGSSEQLGPALGRTCKRAWIHFNLREVFICVAL